MRLLLWWGGRALVSAATLLGVSILIFVAVRMMPGGFADTILGPFATADAKAALAERYRLDQPLPAQYWHWLAALATGDFGNSMLSRTPVTGELSARLPVTAELTLFAIAVTLLVGVPLGVLTAVRARPGGGGAAGRLLSGLGVSVPEFVLAALAVFLFSRYSLGLRAGGHVPFTEDPAGNLRAMTLPALVLSVFTVAATARTTRDAVLNVLVEPYITAAVARGERPVSIVAHHVLRNAAAPVVTLVATLAAYLLGGALIVESAFNLPGIGSYLVQAITRRDYTVVQAGVLLAAAVFIAMNMLVDLAVGLIDPRLGTDAGRK